MSPSKTDPTVCAVMLTADRPEFARRAVECFRAQTYQNKRMVILDSKENEAHPVNGWGTPDDGREMTTFSAPRLGLRSDLTIGQLRTVANLGAQRIGAEVIVHWDDDDYSHPNRIAEQVALLQSSGADCVGYREMLFWDETKVMIRIDPSRRGPEGVGALGVVESVGEAWLYTLNNPSYCLGTSLCYWRKTWERKPFKSTSQGEDTAFTTGLKCVFGAFSISAHFSPPKPMPFEPRMIARIHAGNTSNAYQNLNKPEWKRVPAWDEYCRSKMEGALCSQQP